MTRTTHLQSPGQQGPCSLAAMSEPSAAAINSQPPCHTYNGDMRLLTWTTCCRAIHTQHTAPIPLKHRPERAVCGAQSVVEKASIDEVYMDVTSLVDDELRSRESSRAPCEVGCQAVMQPCRLPCIWG